MKNERIIKLILDIVMYLLFMLLMGYHLTSEAAHKYFGIVLLICFVIHNTLNYRWYKVLLKGKYTIIRSIQTVVNLMLIISSIGCFLSALMISVMFFRGTHISNMMMIGRKLHMFSTAWCFVFMSIHLGLHIPATKVSKQAKVILYVLMLAASINGMHHFLARKFYEELFMLAEFKWFDYEKNIIQYLFETICISLVFVTTTYFIKQLIKFLKEKRRNANKLY